MSLHSSKMLLIESLNDCPSSASPLSDSWECCLARKRCTWTHQRCSKCHFSTLLHTSPHFSTRLPLKSNVSLGNVKRLAQSCFGICNKIIAKKNKKKHLNWSWYKQLLLSYLSSTPYSRSSRIQLYPAAVLNHFTTSFWKAANTGQGYSYIVYVSSRCHLSFN